jgi:CheY-like chemotaxis protein
MSHVLVVDDDPVILDMLRYALRGSGYAVETAGNGLEALHQACRRMPDAIVLDLRMPVMDGHRFIAAWRQVTVGAPIPIVAISAHERPTSAQELGVEAFLPKPFDLRELLGTVARTLRRPPPAAPGRGRPAWVG